MGRSVAQAITSELQALVMMGHHATLSQRTTDSVQFSLHKRTPLRHPAIRSGIFHGPVSRRNLTVDTERTKERTAAVMHGAAPQPGLVKEVIERHGQGLAQACSESLEEATAARPPGETHQAMAELMCGPLCPMGGVKTPNDSIMLE